jgi:Cupredoxin-like domain
MMNRWGLCLAMLIGASSPVMADEPPTLGITIKDHRYQPSELKVPAGKAFVLRIENLDATPEEFESSKLKIEKVIAGGAEGRVRVRPLDPGRYDFIGEYHADTARGVLVAE